MQALWALREIAVAPRSHAVLGAAGSLTVIVDALTVHMGSADVVRELVRVACSARTTCSYYCVSVIAPTHLGTLHNTSIHVPRRRRTRAARSRTRR